MEPMRPGAITVLAILNIVLGSLGFLCNCFGGLGLIMLPHVGEMNNDIIDLFIRQNDFLIREVPGYAIFQAGTIILGLILSALLIGAGIGLLNVRNWARIGALLYSTVKILFELVVLAYTVVLVNPALERFPAQGGDLVDAASANLFSGGWAFLGIAYPIVLLVVLLTPRISAAFARQDFDEDFTDENSGRY